MYRLRLPAAFRVRRAAVGGGRRAGPSQESGVNYRSEFRSSRSSSHPVNVFGVGFKLASVGEIPAATVTHLSLLPRYVLRPSETTPLTCVTGRWRQPPFAASVDQRRAPTPHQRTDECTYLKHAPRECVHALVHTKATDLPPCIRKSRRRCSSSAAAYWLVTRTTRPWCSSISAFDLVGCT